MDLPQSDAPFVKAYPAETTEAFLDGHVSAFAFFGGVPLRVLYDNTRIAVAKIYGGGKRERTRAFTELHDAEPSAGRCRLATTATAEQNQATAEAADQRLAGRSGSCLTYKPPFNGRSLATRYQKRAPRAASVARQLVCFYAATWPKIPPPLTITRVQTSS